MNKFIAQSRLSLTEITLIEMLFKLWKKFCKNCVMMCEKSCKFWESENKQTVHRELEERRITELLVAMTATLSVLFCRLAEC